MRPERLLALGLLLSTPAGAAERVDLDVAYKSTTIVGRAPADSLLFPERWSASALGRLRWTVRAESGRWLRAEVAYEQRARLASGSAGGTSILRSEERAPYRIAQAEWSWAEADDGFSGRHEVDRAVAVMRAGSVDLAVGRQAVGWGRGVQFSVVDIFAPFMALEQDREWRRGIDAVRLRFPLTDLISADGVAAFDETIEQSAFVGRVQGYWGDLDGEILVGTRRRDRMLGCSASLPVMDAELHGELALFDSPDGEEVIEGLAGGSYSFDLQGPLFVRAEYLASGFGAVQCAYGVGSVTPASLNWLISLRDGSGVASGSVSWIFSDHLSLAAGFYVPHGSRPRAGGFRSDYGGTAGTGLFQISFYD